MRTLRWVSVFIFVLLAAEAGLWLRAWRETSAPVAPRVRDGAIKILVIGDSVSGNPGKIGYPHFLENELNRLGNAPRFEVINISRPANVTYSVKKTLKQDLETYDPDYVILMLGRGDFRFRRKSEGVWSTGTEGVLLKSKLYQFFTLQARSWIDPRRIVTNILAENTAPESGDVFLAPDPPDLNRLTKKALGALEDGEYATAQKHAEEALSKLKRQGLINAYPHYTSTVASIISESAVQEDDQKKSVEFLSLARGSLEEAMGRELEAKIKSGLWLQYSRALRARRELSAAAQAAEQAIHLSAENSAAHKQAAWTYFDLSDFKKARAHFRRSLTERPNDRRVLRTVLEMSELDGKWNESRDILAETLPRSRLKYLILVLLARAEHALGEGEKSRAYEAQIEEMKVESGEDLRSRLWLATETRRFEEVDRIFRELPSEGDTPMTWRMAKNFQQIVTEILNTKAYPLVVQYPNSRTGALELALHNYKNRIKIVSTLDMFLEKSDGKQIHSYFAFDFNHLSPAGAEIVGQGLAKIILEHQVESE